MLIENFYRQFVMSDSEVQLGKITDWVPKDLFIDVRSKLHGLDISLNNKYLDDQLNASIDSEKLKAKDEQYKLKLEAFRQERKAIRQFVQL